MSPPDDIALSLSAQMEDLKRRHAYRQRRPVKILSSTHLEIAGRRLINFASNNYLGLTHHPRIIAAACDAIIAGAGAGAAPLVTGYSEIHAAAEMAIARWKGAEDAVLLPSGYQANHAAIQAIAATAERAGRSVRFLVDKLAHASLIDAVRGAGLPFRIFPHNGIAKLRRLLEESPRGTALPGGVFPLQGEGAGPIRGTALPGGVFPEEAPGGSPVPQIPSLPLEVVITESIFSMDGDAADLRAIAALKQEFPFVLLLDEAHASGVYGPEGAGYAAELGLGDIVDLSVVTLSKALGGIGGAICASKTWCEAIVNFGRAYLFSTSLPPSAAAIATTAIEILRDEPQRQARVRLLAVQVREELTRAGFEITPGDAPIIPIVFGDEQAALAASDALAAHGLLIAAIRPPTVPRGSSRLRVTLSCDHTDEEIHSLINGLRQLRRV